jgi:hypothetical protein
VPATDDASSDSDPDVRRWHDNLARRSKNTVEVRLRRIGKFCKIVKLTPAELAEMGRQDAKKVTNLL